MNILGSQIDVVPVALNGLQLDADESFGIVLAQPYFTLTGGHASPFAIHDAFRQAARDAVDVAFRIREAECLERDKSFPLMLFPELSIPADQDGYLDYLGTTIARARGELVFVGGLEGLTVPRAHAVVARYATNPIPLWHGGGNYVNLGVVIIKDASNHVEWHFQSKLTPSVWEQAANMCRGSKLLLFRGPALGFLVLICFDLFAAQGQTPLVQTIWNGIADDPAIVGPVRLDFVFVPQYNESPNAGVVQENIRQVLAMQHAKIDSRYVSIVPANAAASSQEPGDYGDSGVYYHSGVWRATPNAVGPAGYCLADRNGCTPAIIRRRVASVFVAERVPPTWNARNSGNLRLPFERTKTYHLVPHACAEPACVHSRTRGTAGMFTECPQLPCKLRLHLTSTLPTSPTELRWRAKDAGFQAELQMTYPQVRDALLTTSAERAGEILHLLFLTKDDGRTNADQWDAEDIAALVEMASALTAIQCHRPVDVKAPAHVTARIGGKALMVVLDTRRLTGWQDTVDRYLRAHKNVIENPDRKEHKLLVVASRAQGAVPGVVYKYEPSILKARTKQSFLQSLYTRPLGLSVFVCASGFFEQARLEPDAHGYTDPYVRAFSE